MQFLSAAWQGGSHNIPQHHPTSPNNCLNSGFLEALSASNGKCHFEGQRDSSSSLSSVARMCLWWQGLQHLVTASGRYSHPFIPHLLQDCYKSQKKTANLFPGSHLTSSRHQLICDQHGKSSEIKAKVPTWWGDGHPNIFFGGGRLVYLVYAKVGRGSWHVLLGYYACSHSYWSKVYIMCPAVPLHASMHIQLHASMHIQLITKQGPYTDITYITINKVNSSGRSSFVVLLIAQFMRTEWYV